ncbi:hypothetical protein CVT26_011131 [Gymnopilus dilepis]|uniref:F-box domain-containing protein n=1 Tax=Gymnopilus dilepis TaxID=231916 RepID=A0A409VYU6_9AGAR|nr:hypothetical protein CVT26_011131 [Gymnopilus dilepis]
MKTLPTETLKDILASLLESGNSLKSCSLVCSFWHSLIQGLSHKRITLTDYCLDTKAKILRLAEVITTIAMHVKELELTLSTQNFRILEGTKILEEIMNKGALNTLQIIGLQNCGGHLSSDKLHGLIQHSGIQHLAVSGIHLIKSSVLNRPNLRTLQIHQCKFVDSFDFEGTYVMGAKYSFAPTPLPDKNGFGYVEKLCINVSVDTTREKSYLKDVGLNLTALTLERYVSWCNDTSFREITMDNFPNLSSMTIKIQGSSTFINSFDITHFLCTGNPTSLTRVQISIDMGWMTTMHLRRFFSEGYVPFDIHQIFGFMHHPLLTVAVVQLTISTEAAADDPAFLDMQLMTECLFGIPLPTHVCIEGRLIEDQYQENLDEYIEPELGPWAIDGEGAPEDDEILNFQFWAD